MRFLALIAFAATLLVPIYADDEEVLAIAPADIPNACLVLCAPVVQIANDCQAKTAAAAPAEMDDKKKREDDDEEAAAATTADPCICNNATIAIATVGPKCDTCIQANGATTTAVTDLVANCKLPAAAASGAPPPPAASGAASPKSTVSVVSVVTVTGNTPAATGVAPGADSNTTAPATNTTAPAEEEEDDKKRRVREIRRFHQVRRYGKAI